MDIPYSRKPLPLTSLAATSTNRNTLGSLAQQLNLPLPVTEELVTAMSCSVSYDINFIEEEGILIAEILVLVQPPLNNPLKNRSPNKRSPSKISIPNVTSTVILVGVNEVEDWYNLTLNIRLGRSYHIHYGPWTINYSGEESRVFINLDVEGSGHTSISIPQADFLVLLDRLLERVQE